MAPEFEFRRPRTNITKRREVAANLRQAKRAFARIKMANWDPKNRLEVLTKMWRNTGSPEASAYFWRKINKTEKMLEARQKIPLRAGAIKAEKTENFIIANISRGELKPKNKTELARAVKEAVRAARKGKNRLYKNLNYSLSSLLEVAINHGNKPAIIEISMLRGILNENFANAKKKTIYFHKALDCFRRAATEARAAGNDVLAKKTERRMEGILRKARELCGLTAMQAEKWRRQFLPIDIGKR